MEVDGAYCCSCSLELSDEKESEDTVDRLEEEKDLWRSGIDVGDEILDVDVSPLLEVTMIVCPAILIFKGLNIDVERGMSGSCEFLQKETKKLNEHSR